MKYFIIAVILSSLLCGCSRDNTGEMTPTNVAYIDLDNIYKPEELAAIIDTVEVLPLKSIEMASISQIVYDENFFYTLDIRQQKIFKFNSKGEQIFVINRKGRGDGEYLNAQNIMLSDDCIRVYDSGGFNVLDYSKETGKYIGKKSLLKFFNHYNDILSNGEVIAAYNSSGESFTSDKMLTVYDDKWDKIGSYGTMNKTLNGISIGQYFPLTLYRNEILLTELLSNNIYGITRDSVYLKYKMDFGKATMQKNDIPKYDNAAQILIELHNSDYAISIHFFSENDSYITFTFSQKGRSFTAYYDKKSNKSFVVSLKKDGIDESDKWWVYAKPIAVDLDDYFILPITTALIETDTDLLRNKFPNLVIDKSFDFAILKVKLNELR